MKIIKAYPPMIDAIDAAFNVRGKTIFYAWGNVIYNPKGADIPPELLAHEQVHGDRQGSDVEGWWRKYIADPEFRLAEELCAHHVEYCYALTHGNRLLRRKALKVVSKRLASPMYGRMISEKQAKDLIQCMARVDQ